MLRFSSDKSITNKLKFIFTNLGTFYVDSQLPHETIHPSVAKSPRTLCSPVPDDYARDERDLQRGEYANQQA